MAPIVAPDAMMFVPPVTFTAKSLGSSEYLLALISSETILSIISKIESFDLFLMTVSLLLADFNCLISGSITFSNIVKSPSIPSVTTGSDSNSESNSNSSGNFNNFVNLDSYKEPNSENKLELNSSNSNSDFGQYVDISNCLIMNYFAYRNINLKKYKFALFFFQFIISFNFFLCLKSVNKSIPLKLFFPVSFA